MAAQLTRKEVEALDPTRRKRFPVVRAFVRIEEPLKTEAVRQADQDGISFNVLVTKALVEYLTHRRPKRRVS